VTALALILIAFAPGPAAAHDLGAAWAGGSLWSDDPRVLVPLYLSAVLYLVGVQRLWRRAGHGRGVRHWQTACFWLGWTCLALALVSPLHWLGERLFTAHMIEHELIMAVAAPLIAVSRPIGAFLWAVPAAVRRGLGRAAQARAVAGAWRVASDPLAATALHGVAVWAWHMPALYDRVLVEAGAHWLQHMSFLGTALLFWWSLVYGRARRRGYGAAVCYLFITALHTGVLGILLTVSRHLWYPRQAAFAAAWGLTPLEDQQLAGLVMWVPAGLVYAGAALALAGLWIGGSGTARLRGGAHAAA